MLEESVKAETLAGVWPVFATKLTLFTILLCSPQFLWGKNNRALNPPLKPMICAGSVETACCAVDELTWMFSPLTFFGSEESPVTSE